MPLTPEGQTRLDQVAAARILADALHQLQTRAPQKLLIAKARQRLNEAEAWVRVEDMGERMRLALADFEIAGARHFLKLVADAGPNAEFIG